MKDHHSPIPTQPVPNPEDPGTFVPVRGDGDHSTWFTRNAKRIVLAVCVLSAVLVLLDFAYAKHSYFRVEDVFGFYGLYGFVACVTLVLLAKLLRPLLMRPEDYYDE
ncbi:MAG: hypothetical protein QNJ98_01290 [Planctomycetota bacterium]|nr:hypothetical protein [Planctomycetota bacterium]